MKKIANFRLAVILVLSFLVAIALATYVFVSQKSKLIMFLILLVLFLSFVILSLVFKKKFLIMITAICFFVTFPFLSNYLKGESLNKNLKWNNSEVCITGRISENCKFTTSGNLQIVLDNVLINDTDKLKGKVVLYAKPDGIDLSEITLGKFLSVKTNLNCFTLQSEDLSYALYSINRNVVASGLVMHYDIDVLENEKLSFKDKVRQSVFESLNKNNVKHADIGYAMLFGDTSVLDANVKSDFQSTGIAHLLAVSGLHVSIIVLVINFILHKSKVKFKHNLLILTIILMIYCYFCDFSASVIRASLMAVFALYAKIRGKCYDNLSALSLVAIAILLVNPLEMFNISFILSFFAVLSIIVLMIPIKRFLNNYFYGALANSLSLNLAVQVGLFATNMFFFGRYPALGVVANLVAVPISTIAFVFLIFGIIVSSMLPFMGFVNHVFGFLMSFVVNFNKWISDIGFYFRFGSFSFLAVLLIFVSMFVVSDYVFSDKSKKWICSSGVAAAGLLLMIL